MTPTFQLADPLVHTANQFFRQETSVSMELGLSGVELYYTLDGSEPGPGKTRYSKPVVIRKSCMLKVAAHKKGWLPSDVVSREFIKIEIVAKSAQLENPPSPNYPGNGADTLIDLSKGDFNFRSGEWLGFEGEDMTAVIDLGEPKSLKGIRFSTLSDHSSWIFEPAGATVWSGITTDSLNQAGSLALPKPESQRPNQLDIHSIDFESNQPVQFVKLHLKGQGVVPDWHPGAGGKPWLFIDEILFH